MAAAYAALLSLSHTIDQLQNHSTSLDETQIKSISESTTLLLHLLENYSFSGSQEAYWEGRIADAAHEAEDMIESHIFDRGMTCCCFMISSIFGWLYNSATPEERVAEDMDSIAKDAKEMMMMMMTRVMQNGDDEVDKYDTTYDGSSSRSLPHTNILVGFGDLLVELKDKLTNSSGRGLNRQVIPIVGMGGSGKTALARGIYEDPLVMQYFDIRIWFTISRKCSRQEILVQCLLCLKQMSSKEHLLSEKSEYELGELLFKSLSGRRYLAVIDDLWGVEEWDSVEFFFPEYRNGSRIVVTTRLTRVALSMADNSLDVVKMKFLDDDNSWKLLSGIVFGNKGRPSILEETGKRITKSCRGLPLSIKVIGGLLSKHKQSPMFWEDVLENFNDVLNSEDDKRCSKILGLSYKELPIHLKPCFLYMGAFRGDRVILKSTLIRLWVAEGFVKPMCGGKSLEFIAEEYLKELVDRNLVLVEQLGSTGNIKYCGIHDLLRDLCVKEARKNNFLCIIEEAEREVYSPFKIKRRTVFHSSVFGDHYIRPCISSSLRSLTCDLRKGAIELQRLNFKSVRVLRVVYSAHLIPERDDSMRTIPANLWLLEFGCEKLALAPSIVHLWSLPERHAVIDIWKMPQLRHAMCQGLELADIDLTNLLVVLDNLTTLKGVRNFTCSKELVQRIPNVKKLGLQYLGIVRYCYLDNLCHLHKLESLVVLFTAHLNKKVMSIDSLCYIRPSELGWSLNLPHSLRKLSLWCIESDWEEMGIKIGSLPHLQVLKLIHCHLGPQWETVGGQFQKLKFLHVGCDDLIHWIADSTHFPCLEKLVLDTLSLLVDIPREIGDIFTLKLIQVSNCSNSVLDSVKEIEQEQRDLGNEDLQLLLTDNNKYSQQFSDERSEGWARSETFLDLTCPDTDPTFINRSMNVPGRGTIPT
ncbi:disease resistance protein [Striga asiatica]|uniref:Disease resistance protein n=1 Tax=Striga asiatica TaxID=4170 RepID=A0A5A7Q812_STRAF|nr:disease resistance protein [Striga asiatica]